MEFDERGCVHVLLGGQEGLSTMPRAEEESFQLPLAVQMMSLLLVCWDVCPCQPLLRARLRVLGFAHRVTYL